MSVVRFFEKVICILIFCTVLASGDSIQLRDGRHLQGKYVGGTTTSISFMTDRTIEYFPTSDVVALIFDQALEQPLNGAPSAMQGGCSTGTLQPTVLKGNAGRKVKRVKTIAASVAD